MCKASICKAPEWQKINYSLLFRHFPSHCCLPILALSSKMLWKASVVSPSGSTSSCILLAVTLRSVIKMLILKGTGGYSPIAKNSAKLRLLFTSMVTTKRIPRNTLQLDCNHRVLQISGWLHLVCPKRNYRSTSTHSAVMDRNHRIRFSPQLYGN